VGRVKALRRLAGCDERPVEAIVPRPGLNSGTVGITVTASGPGFEFEFANAGSHTSTQSRDGSLTEETVSGSDSTHSETGWSGSVLIRDWWDSFRLCWFVEHPVFCSAEHCLYRIASDRVGLIDMETMKDWRGIWRRL
jgi:hypothetical protein